MASRGVLVEGALDLAWSHWVGLGVSGVARPPDTAVDLEALLYFTAYVADHDPRLRDEVADWWHQFEQHVSGPRLNAMSNTLDEVRWHGFRDGFPGVKKLSGKSRLERLDTPARSQLRMRAVFGANARAEIMLEMLTSTSDEGWTALALSETGYSKRNIAMVLESLVLGGILTATSEGNRTRYRLRDRDGLARVLAPLPQSSGQWHLRLPIVATFLDLASRIERKDAVTQGIEAQKLVTKLQPELVAVGGLPRLPHAAAATYWPALQKWIVRQLLAEARRFAASRGSNDRGALVRAGGHRGTSTSPRRCCPASRICGRRCGRASLPRPRAGANCLPIERLGVGSAIEIINRHVSPYDRPRSW